MRSWASKAILLALLATQVAATPPRIVDVHDELFARNADTLLILRRVEDNHGRHGVLQTDTLLVFRSLADGADRGFQVVESLVENWIDGPRVAPVDLAHRANPYEFRGIDYWPLRAPLHWREDAFLTRDGLTVRDQGAPVYHLGRDDLKALIEDTLTATASIRPDARVPGGDASFALPLISPEKDCAPDSILLQDETPGDPALVQLRCLDEESGQRATLWIVVPRVE